MNEYPWLKNYPDYVPREINPDQFSDLIELLEFAFKKYGDQPAFCCMDTWITYKELDELSLRFASYLQNELGLQKGDPVAVQSPNLLQYPIVLFGMVRAGLIVVSTNPLYTPREMLHQFNDSGAKAVVIVENFAANLQKILGQTNIKHVILTSIGEMHPFPKKQIVNLVVRKVKKMVPGYNLPKATWVSDALKSDPSRYVRHHVDSGDVAFLQYTGGTTGVSKGAALTHRNLVSNVLQMHAWMGQQLEFGKETVITALPLYHIFSLTVNCLMMTYLGAKNILVTNPRDMKAYFKDLKKHRFSVVTGVNTLYNGMMNQPAFGEVDFSNLKVAVAGGMALQQAVAKEWKSRTNTTIYEGYGLTETSPVLSCNPLDGTDRIGTIGLPFPNTEMKIVDDQGNDLPIGEPGEIVARGPQVMKGYWGRSAETDEVFFNGEWFRTGDIGVMDEDGFFKIVDRKKDMILVSGFNVYPNEVEDVVAEHAKVLEVAAIGVPDEKSNEVVKLFIVKKDPSLDKEEVMAFCRENLTGYKRPKFIEFREELPKSNVGKILRRELREQEAKR